LNILNGWGSECSSPKPGWYFYSCWDSGSLADGGKWDTEHCESCSVVSNAPAGGPAGSTYAMKVVWDNSAAGNCSDGADYRVEYFQNSPNPFYERFYFYSTNLRAATADGFCTDYKFGRMSGDGCAATGIYIYTWGGAFYPTVKNHADIVEEYEWNYRHGEKLDGRGDWPGKQGSCQVYNNTWHSIELGVYRHDTAGWIKLWIDGNLCVNASGSAFSATTDYAVSSGGSGNYDTNVAGCPEAFLQLPGFRNGGENPAHTEYFKNVILSSSYIGPIGGGTSDPPPPAPKGFSVSTNTN